MGAGASSGRRGSVLISPRAEAMSTKNENGVSSSRSSFCQNYFIKNCTSSLVSILQCVIPT